VNESRPVQGSVRLGIEIEGVGVLKMEWNPKRPSLMAGLSRVDHPNEEQEAQISEIKETIKRQPLVRSASFSEDFAGTVRGLSIHAELPATNRNLGLQHPAELVTTPHLLNATHLTYLKNSVNKVIRGGTKGALSKSTSAQAFAVPATELLPSRTVTTRFYDETRGQLPHSIQTTVGVAADRLLSNDRRVRLRIIHFLTVPGSEQCNRFTRLVDAACAAQAALPLAGDLRYRVRLALLMSLLHVHAQAWKGSGMEKDVYGANVKGYSSFEGCGLDDTRTLMALLDAAETLVEHLVRAEIDPGRAERAVDGLGQPGLSAQVAFERGEPIACFLVGTRLHTVIEARQLDAPINHCIYTMLLAKPRDLTGATVDPAAQAAALKIRTQLGHS